MSLNLLAVQSSNALVPLFISYLKIFPAGDKAAKRRGYDHPWFSSNNIIGRCDECAGYGIIVTELQFMADVETGCPFYKGTGFSSDILEVTYNGKTSPRFWRCP